MSVENACLLWADSIRQLLLQWRQLQLRCIVQPYLPSLNVASFFLACLFLFVIVCQRVVPMIDAAKVTIKTSNAKLITMYDKVFLIITDNDNYDLLLSGKSSSILFFNSVSIDISAFLHI